jgi:hypothetical protein
MRIKNHNKNNNNLNSFKTHAFTLRKQYEVQMFDNKVIRKTFEPKRRDVRAGGALRNEGELWNSVTSEVRLALFSQERKVTMGRTRYLDGQTHTGFWLMNLL